MDTMKSTYEGNKNQSFSWIKAKGEAARNQCLETKGGGNYKVSVQALVISTRNTWVKEDRAVYEDLLTRKSVWVLMNQNREINVGTDFPLPAIGDYTPGYIPGRLLKVEEDLSELLEFE